MNRLHMHLLRRALLALLPALIFGLAAAATWAAPVQQDQPTPTPTIDPLLQPSPLPTPLPSPIPAPPLTGTVPLTPVAPITGGAPITGAVPLTSPVPPASEQPTAPVAPVAPVTQTAVPITFEQLLNVAIIVPSISPTGTVQLANGVYSNLDTGLTVAITSTRVAFGDLNGDGVDDAAAVVQVTRADGTVGYDLAVFTNQGTLPVALAATTLGSPVLVDALRVEKSAVWVDLRVLGPADNPCCPTLALKRIYLLRTDKLIELPAAAFGRLFPYRYGKLYGYVNVLGEFVVPPQFAFAGDFTEGLALVSYDGALYGFINRLGQIVILLEYQFATPFSAGLTVAGLPPASAGGEAAVAYLNRSGDNVFGTATFAAGQPFSEGLAAVKTASGKFGFIDRTGDLVIPAQYDYALSFSEGLAAVLIGDKVGYINRIGALVIEPQFDAADLFAEGVAAVAADGKVGYIDHAGNFAIEPTFARGERFGEGLAPVLLDEQEIYVNHAGATTIAAPAFTDAQNFAEGLAAVKVGDLFGYMDGGGTLAIAPQFVTAGPFDGGLAVVETSTNWGVIGADGAWLVQLTLLQPTIATTGTVAAPITGTVASTTTAALGTAIVTFVPPIPDEIRQGACYTGSDLLSVTTVWRCGLTGGEVFDPCVLGADGKTVVCGANPATNEPGFALELTAPLPVAAVEGKTYPGAWLFQLGNGAICTYKQGESITVEGQRINYTCSDLTQLLGDIDKSGPVWTINIVTTSDDGQGNYAIETLTPMTIVRTWLPGITETPAQNQ